MGILGDIVGIFAGNGDEDAAKNYLADVNPEADPSAWQGLTSAAAAPSAWSSVATDQGLRANQLGSLNALRALAQQGGLRTEDRVAQNQAMAAANQNERANRGAIFQNMASRGLGGSAMELSEQLANQQGAAQRNAMAGAQTASDASKRALQAISASGEMAGQIRGQDASEAGARASGLDRASQFATDQANRMATARAAGLDAVSRFNAGQRLNRAGMQSGLSSDWAQRNQQRWTNVGNDVDQGVSGFLTGGLKGGGLGIF